MTDKFDEFENKVVTWCGNHKWLIYIIVKLLVMWISFALIVTAMLAPIGGSKADEYMQQEFLNGNKTIDEMQTWNNLVVPVMVYSVNTTSYLSITMMILFIIGVIYFGNRGYYKRKNKKI